MVQINEIITNEIIINKSRFITTLFPVKNIDDVNYYLSITKKKYYDATHNCYAYILGSNSEIQKCSDDGEPQKTAGFPMLDVLKKNNLTNILAITTRYFGGILLGAGGLIRAYSDSVAQALKDAKLYQNALYQKIIINIDYSLYNNIVQDLNKYKILNQDFKDSISLILGIKKDEVDNFKKKLINQSKGKAIILEDEDFESLELIKQ